MSAQHPKPTEVMWQMLSEMLDGEKLPESLNKALYGLCDGTLVVSPAMQHVAYFDEGEFHWMSGIKPRDCELFAKRGEA